MASDQSKPEPKLEPEPTMEVDESNTGDTNSKRDREESDNLKQDIDDEACKKQKVVDDNDDGDKKLVEDNEEDPIKENSGPVNLGPKLFGSSFEMFEYFFKLLRDWPLNTRVNKYEYLVLLDLIKKGHPEPDKKIGSGIDAFEVRNHPEWKSRCFFAVRGDKTVEDFSFRKCVDHILPLPENIKNKFDSKTSGGGGGGGRRGGGGKGGGRGRGRGRGGKFRR